MFDSEEAERNAARAGLRTGSKVGLELPLLALVAPDSQLLRLEPDVSWWKNAAQQERREILLSDASIALLRSKLPATSREDDAKVDELVERLKDTLALDTVLNEFAGRQTIRTWFADGEVSDLSELNERVYRKIFLTPHDDAWLGLRGDNAFLAMEIE
jgi:hypothetical protein